MKYRIWDETRKEYVQDYDDFYINPVGELSIISLMWEGEQEWCKPERYVIEQFTGLKDKNGKEIFEGDVVDVTYSDREGNTHYMKMEMKNPFDYTIEDAISLDYSNQLEIIGNIHE